MDSLFKKQNREMAFGGYYNASDFARLKGNSRQYINNSKGKFQTIERYDRTWFKYDNGELGEKRYGNPSKYVDMFIDFGFNKRMKSLAQNNKAIVDVKRINDQTISIRFYNQKGETLCCEVDVNNIELIEADNSSL